MQNLSIVHGDITVAKVDAIVNAANPIMLGGGGVDGAIHRAAGPALLEECRKVKAINGVRCPVGEARITGAGRLAANFVIHTVGPRYRIDADPPALLTAAYTNSLLLAKQNNCRSVAFPAISCGAYGYPMEQAATIAIGSCGQSQFNEINIQLYLFSISVFDVWQQALSHATAAN